MELGEFGRLKRGTAAITACLVKTLNESDPTFQDRFLGHLETAYRKFKNQEGPFTQGELGKLTELELISWVTEMITGQSFGVGQKEPFLE